MREGKETKRQMKQTQQSPTKKSIEQFCENKERNASDQITLDFSSQEIRWFDIAYLELSHDRLSRTR